MFAASKSGQSVVAATDPYFKYVPLLLETTSTNGQQNNTFLDSSTNAFTITRNGTPTQGSVTPYWPDGYWSNNFPSAVNSYLTIAYNAAFNIASSTPFTIEFWFNTTGFGGTTNAFISNYNGAPAGWTVSFLGASNVFSFGLGDTTILTSSSQTISVGVWYHFALVRNSSNSISMYLNGTSIATPVTNSGAIGATSQGPWIGGTPGVGQYYHGYISNLRVVNGTAVYTGAFTSPTTPLTAITNTSLLTCQSNRFKDNSTNNFTLTPVSTPTVQAFQPFSPTASYTTAAYGGSGYFNGSSDYLSVASNAALNLTADFTVEAWAFATATTNAADQVFNYGNFIFMLYHIGTTWTVEVGNGSSNYFSLSGTASLNAWHHFAITRSTNTYTFWIDGVSAATTSNSNAPATSGATLYISRRSSVNDQYFTGYISNFRIVKGTAVYTGAFTPPTAPVTAITNTSLLTNFTNAGIYDAAAQNNELTVGSAQASTTVPAKWSPTSMKFNGTTDYLSQASNPAFAFGNGNFTLECWIYATAASDSAIYEGRASGTGAAGFTLTAFSSSVIRVFTNGAVIIASSGTTYLNQWTHVAVVRSSGTTTLYINGTSVGTSAGMGNLTDTTPLVGAGRYTGLTTPSSFFTGYIQDFRMTNGIARYTANFSVPTAAFPTR